MSLQDMYDRRAAMVFGEQAPESADATRTERGKIAFPDAGEEIQMLERELEMNGWSIFYNNQWTLKYLPIASQESEEEHDVKLKVNKSAVF